MRILSCIALLVLLCCVQRPVWAQTSCEGDCDGDGVVRIDELLRAVNVALGAQSLDVCPILDTDGSGQVEISELIAAVVRALIGCQLTGDAAAEAAALFAQGIIDSVTVLDFGVVGAQGGGGKADAQAVAARPDQDAPRPRGQATSCPGGGSSAESCVVVDDVSQLTVESKDCRRVLTDLLIVSVDGTAVTTVEDAKFCDTRVVRAGVTVTQELTGARQRILDRDDNELVALSATTKRRFRPTEGRACNGQNGTVSVEGVKQFRCTASSLLPRGTCPPEGRALTVQARDLTIERQAVDTDLGCDVRRRLSGGMATIDAVSEQRFDAVYQKFLVSQLGLGNGASALSLDGVVIIPCLGDVRYTTDKPLDKTADDRCPSSGELGIEFPDGMHSRALFGTSVALAIDFDADGKTDLELDSCEDPKLARCQ